MNRLRYGQVTRPDPNNTENTIVSGLCQVTKKPYEVSVPTASLKCWLEGADHIQYCLASLSKDDREFLISGTSPEGWEKLFGNPDEDEEDGNV